MSKVFQSVPNALKAAGKAIAGYDDQLPQSNLTPGFKGKGLLTALIDNTHSELARRRKTEDDLKNGAGKYLIDNFWNAVKQGTPAEMKDYQERLLGIYGQDKHVKKWLTEELFPRAEQLQQATQQFKAPGAVVAKPEMPSETGQPAGTQSAGSSAELPADPDVTSTYTGLTPPPGRGPTGQQTTTAPAQPFASPMMQVQDPEAGMMDVPMEAQPQSMTVSTSAPAGPVAAGITPPPQPTPTPAQPPRIPQPPAPLNPLQSILQKVSPIPLTERDKLQYAADTKAYEDTMGHGNKMTEQAAKDAAEMDRLQAQITAGRFDKIPKNAQIKAVKDPASGKIYYTAIYNDPVTGQPTQTLLDDYEAAAIPGTGSAGGPTEQDIQSAMQLYGVDRIKAREIVEQIKARGRAQGTADINGVPLAGAMVNGLPTNLPRSQAAGTPMPVTLFDPNTGAAATGGVADVSRTPPSEQRIRDIANAQSGLKVIGDLRTMLAGDSGVRIKAALPGSPGARTYEAARKELVDIVTRLRTGAALNKDEEVFYAGQGPTLLDSPETVQYKLQLYEAMIKALSARQAGPKLTGGKEAAGKETNKPANTALAPPPAPSGNTGGARIRRIN